MGVTPQGNISAISFSSPPIELGASSLFPSVSLRGKKRLSSPVVSSTYPLSFNLMTALQLPGILVTPLLGWPSDGAAVSFFTYAPFSPEKGTLAAQVPYYASG